MNKRSVLCLSPALPGRSIRLSRMVPRGAWPVLGRVSLITAALVTAGLASCDSTAKFSLPDTKFQQVQVVSAFPAFIDPATNAVTRVCGAPIDDTDNANKLVPNGVELVVNFVSTELRMPACAHDRDLGIKEGEYIELQSVKTTGYRPTVGPQNFEMQLACLEERVGDDPNAECTTSLGTDSQTLKATTVRYQPFSNRCTDDDNTHINVALVIDHSGSTSGLVNAATLLEDVPGAGAPPKQLTEVKSDRYDSRISSAELFLDSLNDLDRAIAYYFDESGVSVAAMNSYACLGGAKDDGINKVPCNDLKDTTTCTGGVCAADDTKANDTFVGDFASQQAAAFGRMGDDYRFKDQLKGGLDTKAKFSGSGRAPIWQAVDTAFTFMSASLAKANRHIVLVADGPDTCTESEDFFNYKDLSTPTPTVPKCRVPCLAANVQYKTLLSKIKDLQDKGDNVVIDVVQFQSAAKQYQQPDSRMMELACRTNGTYQFVNTSKFNRSKPDEWTHAFNGAMQRIRYSLAGNWRPAYAISALSNADPVGMGKVAAIKGGLQFQNSKFPSLATAYEQNESWRFAYSGAEDRRLVFRRAACATSADCGGSDACGANHCSSAGLCTKSIATDRLTCGEPGGTKRCCGGACGTDACKDACKL